MRRIEHEELNEIMRLHGLWLKNDPKGERAVLIGCDLSRSNLSGSDLSGSNIDNACIHFSCKSLSAKFDQKHIVQILYHAAMPTQNNELVIDDDLRELLNSDIFKRVVNKFHRVDECGVFIGSK